MRAIDPAVVDAAAGKGPIGSAVEAVRRIIGLIVPQRNASIAPSPPTDSIAERPNAESEVQRTTQAPAGDGTTFFGPGTPLPPVARYGDVAGRQFDFQTGANATAQPRRFEGITFPLLRALADYDLVRLAIETRKDQVSRISWSILPKRPSGQKYSPPKDKECERLEKFFSKPDGINGWEQWVRSICEDSFVMDGVALYRRRTRGNDPYALEQIDAATISLLIDKTGRRPLPPNPAFQQILKGVPAIEYTSDELVYSVRNPRAHRVYGLGQVEQIVTYINLGLRRVTKQLQTYAEGNVPDSLISVPESWTAEQINMFQRYWDAVMENPQARRKARFIPAGMNYWPTHSDTQIYDQFDEWLARVVAYAFSLPATPFVRQMNRATAESAYETALEEGLEPMLKWIKRLIDNEIEHFLGAPGYELVWDKIRTLSSQEQQQVDLADIRAGVKSIDEVREARGDTPIGLPHIIWGVGPLGFMSVDAVKKAIQMNLDMPQPPPPPDMGMGGMPGDDPFAGADPALLAQLGLDQGQGQQQGMQGQGPNDMQQGAQQGMTPPPNPLLAGPSPQVSKQPVDTGAALRALEAEFFRRKPAAKGESDGAE